MPETSLTAAVDAASADVAQSLDLLAGARDRLRAALEDDDSAEAGWEQP